MKESEIERKLVKAVKDLGGLCLKFTSPGFTGVPDRILILDNKIMFVELKAPGKGLRPRQEYVRRQFARLGHKIYVLDTKEKVKKFINEI